MSRFVVQQRQADLLQAVGAVRSPRRATGGLNRRQEQRNQHADNANHYEQFDQRESAAHAVSFQRTE